MYKEGKPLGVHEIQRALDLSSPSISHYHLRKLLQAGLVKEQEGGYVVDRVVFDNMVRIRRSLIPFRTTYLVFFGTTLAILLFFLRPAQISALYIFALVLNLAAVGIFATEIFREIRRTRF
jgi:DNA-binding transcriptional ArsR family regulator